MLKVPVEWLKEYVKASLPIAKLADKLTMAGMEVTSIDGSECGGVLSLEITPNRADCLSIIGLAREVAAITGAKLNLPKLKGKGKRGRGKGNKSSSPLIQIEDRKDCQLYIGRVIESVKIGQSPEWIKKRLLACGVRPINNIVDITNYVLLEFGQPLHAFDNKKLTDGKIIVRRARHGESIVTIDGEARPLSKDILIIADSRNPVAVAGVMGGKATEIGDSTREILLESAAFNPVIVRRSSRALGLSSESSYRFERGVDISGVEIASVRATQLICDLAGGELVSSSQAGSQDFDRVKIILEPSQAEKHLGIKIAPHQIRQSLRKLGFGVKEKKGSFIIEAPSFRRDVRTHVDLVEDIARLKGYENFPDSLPVARVGSRGIEANKAYFQVHEIRSMLAGLGLNEIMTWALISENEIRKSGLSGLLTDLVRLSNPLSQDHSVLRPTLLVGMLRALSRNMALGFSGVRLFEVGNVFEGGAAIKEKLTLSLGLSGAWNNDWQFKQESNLFILKGIIEKIVQNFCGKQPDSSRCELEWAEPGECMQISLNGNVVAHAGRIKKDICSGSDLEHPAWFAQACVSSLLPLSDIKKELHLPSQFPSVKRDISFTVDKSVPFSEIESLIKDQGRPMISKAELVDRYTGKQISKEKHSLTFSLEYSSPSRTLTAQEVDLLHGSIAALLAEKFKAQLR